MANSKHGMTVYRILTTCTGWDLAEGSSKKKRLICYQDVQVCASHIKLNGICHSLRILENLE